MLLTHSSCSNRSSPSCNGAERCHAVSKVKLGSWSSGMRKRALAIALVGVWPGQSLKSQATIIGAASSSITPVDNTIFYENSRTSDPARPWQKLPVHLDIPSGETKTLIPARSGKFAMIGMTCSAISPNKHLLGCKIEAEPKDMGYEAVGAEIAKRVVVDPTFSVEANSAIKFISLQFRVMNSDSLDVTGPCWPPSCIIEPGPPPRLPTSK